MLEAQDAGGRTKQAADTEFGSNEEVPSNSPGNEVGQAYDLVNQRQHEEHRPWAYVNAHL